LKNKQTTYRKAGRIFKIKNLRLLCMFVIVHFQSCSAQSEKINGVSFVASNTKIAQHHVAPLVNLNANYAAIMPFGYLKSLDSPSIIYNTSRQWYGESVEGAKYYIKIAQSAKIKIMLKPQIWIWGGAFTGHIKMTTEADWNALENSYSKFILEYAKLAEDLNVELFCIGTELEQFTAYRPQYWAGLIKAIRQVYKGKLTYAANWDEFKRTDFWADLDYIGIDAYFPINDAKTPSVEACISGWQPHKTVISNLSKGLNKPVLFTEFGYRSVDYTAKAPWRSDRAMNTVNLQAQENATQALFEVFWDEPWFKGGFIWKWFHNHATAGGHNNSRYTPQNKPVEAYIKEQFTLY
jgi:hypothetical protein